MSCAGNGYLSGNMLVDFPFREGQDDAWGMWGPEGALALRGCFVDAAVTLYGEPPDDEEWPSIGRVVVGPSWIQCHLFAGGSESRIIVGASGDQFPTIWKSEPWGAFVITFSSGGIRGLCDLCSSGFAPPPPERSSSGEGGGAYRFRICDKCVAFAAGGLSSIRVFDGVSPKSEGPHFVLRGDVSVKPGNNMRLSEMDATGTAAGDGLSLNAEPGGGMGVVPCGCERGASVASPLSRADGNVKLLNDTSFDLEPFPEVETRIVDGEERPSRRLVVHSKVTACCTCEMYASIVNDGLASLATAIRKAKADLGGMLSKYESSVRLFNSRLADPTLSDVTVSLSGMPVGRNVGSKVSGGKVSGRMARCAFSAVVGNSSYARMDVSVFAMSGTDSVIESSAAWTDESGSPKAYASDSGLVGMTFPVYPGRSLLVSFVSARDAMLSSASSKGFSGSVSFGISYVSADGRSTSLGIVDKTVTVEV